MGNCQAAEAAAVLIQQPGGKVERMYWAIAAGEVMKANPGHYVAAVLATPPGAPAAEKTSQAPVRHLKLLRPDDTLCLGRVYRLVTFEGSHFSCPEFIISYVTFVDQRSEIMLVLVSQMS